MKKNYFLDIVLFISSLICIGTGSILDFHLIAGGKEIKILLTDWHIYSGYVMTIGLLIHLVWHFGWIKSVSKFVFARENKKSKRKEQL